MKKLLMAALAGLFTLILGGCPPPVYYMAPVEELGKDSAQTTVSAEAKQIRQGLLERK